MNIPKISNSACVTDDPQIAAEFSLCHTEPHCYTPVYEVPIVTEFDQRNAVLKVADSVVKSGVGTLYLGNVDSAISDVLKSALPSEVKLEEYIPTAQGGFDTQSLPLRLLAARLAGSVELPNSHQGSFIAGNEPHLVVLEEDTPISAIIASNYAWSLGASMQTIPRKTREEGELICRRIFESDAEGDMSSSEAMEEIKEELRLHCQLQFIDYECITFITSRPPYGIAYPEVPSTHLFVYPMLGRAIANAIAMETHKRVGIEIAITIDPLEAGTELETVARTLHSRHAQVLRIRGRSASVDSVEKTIEVFPYDLLAISTHAGEATGVRVKYEFEDVDGDEHELIIDEAVSFGTSDISEDEKIHVRHFHSFVSIDGYAWTKKNDHLPEVVIKKAMEAYWQLPKEVSRLGYRTILEEGVKVPHCMALSMNDGNYLPMLHFIADQSCPVVFNNACSSWQELSLWFTFAGARAYIGTLYPVLGVEAEALGSRLFGPHVHRPLAMALWRAQADTFPDTRKPYVMVGAHFCRLSRPSRPTRQALALRLGREIRHWDAYGSQAVEESLRSKGRDYAAFLKAQRRSLGL